MMTIEEALKIVSRPDQYTDNPMMHQRFDNSRGFIAGWNAAVKACSDICKEYDEVVLLSTAKRFVQKKTANNVNGLAYAEEILKLSVPSGEGE